jgi:hypothetical protein
MQTVQESHAAVPRFGLNRNISALKARQMSLKWTASLMKASNLKWRGAASMIQQHMQWTFNIHEAILCLMFFFIPHTLQATIQMRAL